MDYSKFYLDTREEEKNLKKQELKEWTWLYFSLGLVALPILAFTAMWILDCKKTGNLEQKIKSETPLDQTKAYTKKNKNSYISNQFDYFDYNKS